MRLADRIAQCRTPFIVKNTHDGSISHLNGAHAFADAIGHCPTRYVLSDELTRLCTALAYSRGARRLACADLLRIPNERVWVEWTEAPWLHELALYGFNNPPDSTHSGRRGVFLQTTRQGRCGVLRTFWSNGGSESDVLTSSMEACFDFDRSEEDEPEVNNLSNRSSIRVSDAAIGRADILRRCFRFDYESSWQNYYESARLPPAQARAVALHALGTIAIDIPVLLAFFLLLATRPGLPRRPLMLERLNRARGNRGKVPLLEQIEVSAPLLPHYNNSSFSGPRASGKTRRLHHVRGHLVRRGSTLFWRVPHLRGSARAGRIQTRTVTWLVESSPPSRGV